MFKNQREKACYMHHLGKIRKKSNCTCLYCKYKDEYKSNLAVRMDDNYNKIIIVPAALDFSIVAEELAKDYPSYFCYNRKLFNEFEKEKESNTTNWIDFLKENDLTK